MKKSTQVAIGGVSSAICLLMMFMTSLIPFSSYVFPALAGMVLIVVAEENGVKTALLVFAVTSILALMIVPDREAVLMFIMLLGYYPMLKPKIERLFNPLAFTTKIIFANTIFVLFYFVMKYLFGVPDMVEGWGDFGKYTIFVIFGMINFTFLMYDSLLLQVFRAYTQWFRPKILHKIIR